MPVLFILFISKQFKLHCRQVIQVGWIVLIAFSFTIGVPFKSISKAADPNTTTHPDPETKKQIDKLVQDLDSSSRKVRQKAEKEILDIPSHAVPYLRAVFQNGNLPVSVTSSLSSILIKMEYEEIRRLKESVKIEFPSRLNVKSVLKQLVKKTGNRVSLFKNNEPELRLNFETKQITFPNEALTFWQTIALLEKQTGLQVHQIDKSSRLSLRTFDQKTNPNSLINEDGLFRITLNSARIDPLPNDPDHSKLRINLKITSVPRLFPLILFFENSRLELISDNGTPVLPLSPESQIEISPAGNSKVISFHIDYLVPESLIAELKSFSLKGESQLVVATWKENFQFSLTKKKTELSRHLHSLKLEDEETELLKNEAEAFRLNLLADYDLDREKYGMLFESHRRAIFKNSPYLIDQKTGKKIEAIDSHSHMEQDSNLLLYQIEFRDLDRDKSQYQLIFPAYTIFELMPVQIEFPEIVPDKPNQ